MIRFLINFVLFGLLFFFIHKFFPDAFTTLVAWIAVIYDFLYEAASSLVESVQQLIRKH